MKLKTTFIALLLLAISSFNSAAAFPIAWHGISAAIGHNWGDKTIGGRISYQFQPKATDAKFFSIYFDASVAYWHMPRVKKYTSVANIAFAPAIRFHPYNGKHFVPYLEISVGPSFLSKTRFGGRRFGVNYAFQDMMGGGITFGSRLQYDISWRYLHYSNLCFSKYNNGLNIQTLITFAYHF